MRGLVYAAVIALISLLAIPSVVSAQPTFYCAGNGATYVLQSPPSGNDGPISQCIQAAVPYVIVGLLFSFQLVAFAYLIGEVIGVNSFRGWYRTELWEAVKSLLIVALIFAGIFFLGALAGSIVGSNSGTESNLGSLYFAAQNNYLTPVQNTVQNAYYAITGINTAVGYEESISMGYQLPDVIIPVFPIDLQIALGTGVNFNPFASQVLLATRSSSTLVSQTFSLLIVPMTIVVALQSLLITFFAMLSLGVLIPLGIVMRAIPFLRWIGGTLLALGITGAFIYPALLVFFNAPVTNMLTIVSNNNFSGGCSGFYYLFCAVLGAGDAAAVSLQSGLSGTQLTAYQQGYQAGELAFAVGGGGEPSFTPVMNVLMDYSLPVSLQFILFILDMIIGITLATGLATALGGRLRLSLGKFRFA